MNSRGMSQVMGIMCMLLVVVVASISVYAAIPRFEAQRPPVARVVIESVDLSDHQEVVLLHTGGETIDLPDIRIEIYVDGVPSKHSLHNLPCGPTPGFYGPPSGVFHRHTGILGNLSNDNTWSVGEQGGFKIARTTNAKLSKGDMLEIRIIDKKSGVVVSVARHRI